MANHLWRGHHQYGDKPPQVISSPPTCGRITMKRKAPHMSYRAHQLKIFSPTNFCCSAPHDLFISLRKKHPSQDYLVPASLCNDLHENFHVEYWTLLSTPCMILLLWPHTNTPPKAHFPFPNTWTRLASRTRIRLCSIFNTNVLAKTNLGIFDNTYGCPLWCID